MTGTSADRRDGKCPKVPRAVAKVPVGRFEEHVISAPRSIRNFGKRFRESEMGSIFVETKSEIEKFEILLLKFNFFEKCDFRFSIFDF